MTSIFSKIISREIPANIIYEDENHIAFLDIHPFEKWHTLVVPKHEYKTIFDMNEDAYLELQKIVLKIAKHYEKVLSCGMNILQNNKEIAGQTVPHVHFHIIPRLTTHDSSFFQATTFYQDWEIDIYKEKLTLS